MATPNCTFPTIPLSADYLSVALYSESLAFIHKQLPSVYQDKQVTLGVVCGSGLGGLSSLLTAPICEFKYENIPHFGISTVLGHEGKLVFGMLSGQPTVCMVGRKHMYEGHASIKTAFPIRVMSLLGVKILIVTNAVGGLNKDYIVGDIMVMSDHQLSGISGNNPLIGKNINEFGTRFPATSDAYDYGLRLTAFKAAGLVGLPDEIMKEGIYAYVSGPSFETRAEARYLRAAGADVVGMSTVPEVIVARHCGMKVLGFSLVTNGVAASVGKSAKEEYLAITHPKRKRTKTAVVLDENDESMTANHAEVLETGNKMSKHMQTLVAKVVELHFTKE